MSGPCLCGDPNCGRCFPVDYELTAAQDWVDEVIYRAELSPEEYYRFARHGLYMIIASRSSHGQPVSASLEELYEEAKKKEEKTWGL
jgi:hypothetical protein